MKVIGVVGGIASGKSTVSRLLGELDAEILDADQAGHVVLRDPQVIELLEQRWGLDVLDEDGQIDRQAVAARVFGELPNAAQELAFLESVTHPRIGAALEEQINQARAAKTVAVVLDAPLLFEAGWDSLCDCVIFAEADESTRIARALQRGWTEADWRQRETSQAPVGLKRERADWIIATDVPIEDTRRQLAKFWREVILSTAR